MKMNVKATGPYSQGVVVNNTLFSSGQIALDPATGEIVGSTIEEQAEQVMKNLGAILEEAGAFSVLIFFMSNTSLVSKFIFSVLFYSFA